MSSLAEYSREQARAALAARGPAPDHVVAVVNRALREGGDSHDAEGSQSRLVVSR